MSRRQEDVRVPGLVLERKSEKAWLCRKATDLMHENEFWIPVSQLIDSDMSEMLDEGYIVIPHWLAKDKDLLG